jgi:hypothetical protein
MFCNKVFVFGYILLKKKKMFVVSVLSNSFIAESKPKIIFVGSELNVSDVVGAIPLASRKFFDASENFAGEEGHSMGTTSDVQMKREYLENNFECTSNVSPPSGFISSIFLEEMRL